MSKLGFDKDLRKIKSAEKTFLRQGIKLAQKEFSENFKNERDSETGKSWNALIARNTPPPILDVTSKLRMQAIKSGKIIYHGNSATLYVVPIDKRGREYSGYHQHGFTHRSGKFVEARPFITQSLSLTKKQENLLHLIFDRIIL